MLIGNAIYKIASFTIQMLNIQFKFKICNFLQLSVLYILVASCIRAHAAAYMFHVKNSAVTKFIPFNQFFIGFFHNIQSICRWNWNTLHMHQYVNVHKVDYHVVNYTIPSLELWSEWTQSNESKQKQPIYITSILKCSNRSAPMKFNYFYCNEPTQCIWWLFYMKLSIFYVNCDKNG